jgi:phosphoglycerol transferase MdoB-like AlkP superfamily enzyme
MGFDEFIDLQGFRGMATSGPYIGDTAVAVKVDEILEENRARANSAPLFIFVITMENHGPLHLEHVRAGEIEQLYAVAPPEGCDDLTIYLRHLVNAARMSGMIRESLEKSEREGWLCFFGDHLPIMARVYQTLGYPDGDSDYLLWSNRGGKVTAQALDMKVEDLAELIFKHAGLAE